MEDQSTEQLIKQQVESLPKPVREAIASFDWAREVYEIGHKRSLHIDAIGEIQTEVMLVVLGLISPRDFYDQMVTRIGIHEDQALEIADEVNTKVFIRIREFMKNYYAEEEKKASEIVPSERQILSGAGIKLGDEPDDAPVVVPEDSGEQLISLEPSPRMPSTPAIFNQTKRPADTPMSPTIEEKLSSSAVFKNPPKNYFDPYREPVE